MHSVVSRAGIAVVAVLVAAVSSRAELPYGADFIDQSAYALGTMRLSVIFFESNGTIDANQENWTPAQLATVRSEIDEAVAFWEGLTAHLHPNARLRIDVHYPNNGNPIPIGYEPINRSSSQDSLWINQAMNFLGYNNSSHFTNVRNFNHDQRLAANTNWASTIFVVNDDIDADNRFTNSMFAYAHIGGPYLMTTYGNNGWNPDRYNRVASHELAHMFFALDEYAGGGERNTARSGYLNGVNGNSELNASGQTIVPPQPNALMLNNTLNPSPFTLVQIGILDTDGDTVPDILDTFPTLTGSDVGSISQTGTFVFSGSVIENPLDNRNTRNIGFTSSGNDITINWIADAQYALDGGPWTSFAAADGAYNRYTESLAFTLPGLLAGLHTIEIRALNSVDNESNRLRFEFTSTNPVPEPAAWSLAALLLSWGAIRHCRRTAHVRP